MAYPQLITANTSNSNSTGAGLTASILMPSNLQFGDLIAIVYHSQDNGGNTALTISENLGIFQKEFNDVVPTTTNKHGLFWKWSNGTESGQSVTISHDSGATINPFVASAFCIRGAHYSKTPTFTYSSGLSTVSSPSVTAPWGADENLFLSFISNARNGTGSFTSYPSGYTNGSNFRVSTSGIIAQSSKQSLSATEDPGDYAISANSGGYVNISMVVGPPPASVINSINNHVPIRAGQKSIPMSLTGYPGIPSSITATYSGGTKSLICSNIQGTVNDITFDIEDREQGNPYPLDTDIVRFTVNYQSTTAYIDTTVINKVGENKQTFVLPVFDDIDYLTTHFSNDGLIVQNGVFIFTAINFLGNSFVLNADGSINCNRSGGIVKGWFRPSNGLGAGNVYYYEFNINSKLMKTLTQFTLQADGLLSSKANSSGNLKP